MVPDRFQSASNSLMLLARQFQRQVCLLSRERAPSWRSTISPFHHFTIRAEAAQQHSQHSHLSQH